MWIDTVFILSVLALVVSIGAIIESAVFYRKSTRELQHITKVIVDYLQMAMNNQDIKPSFDKKGRLVNWSVTLHPSGIVHGHTIDSPTLTVNKP